MEVVVRIDHGKGENFLLIEDERSIHNEYYWSRRFLDACSGSWERLIIPGDDNITVVRKMPHQLRIAIRRVDNIEEFRGISKLSKSLPMRKFNVLIGKNNSGKSAMLEALFLTVGFITNRAVLPVNKRIGPEVNLDLVLAEPITGVSILKFLESRHKSRRSLIYKYTGSAKISLDLNPIGKIGIELDSKGSTRKLHGPQIEFDSMGFVKKLHGARIENKEPFEFRKVLYFPYDTRFIKDIDTFLESQEDTIIKKGLHTEVAKLISSNLDENFTEIVLKKDGWYLRREDASYVHVDDVGDGLKKVVRVVMSIELINPSIILWDDFDTSLHPSMIKMLLNWLTKRDWQVVLSTHSIDVLYYLADLSEEIEYFDAQVVLLKKDQKDVLHHQELTMDELEDLLEGNVDPRMLVSELKI